MALSLSAEQKNISNMFGGKNQYIIPEYQRPYSWEEKECMELFDDLLKAFRDNEDGYFLGNIVVAESIDELNRLEVIDGQQRLTTFTILMRVLFSFDKDNKKLKNLIWELDDRTDAIIDQRLITKVFEDKDSVYLNEILDINFRVEDLKYHKNDNQYKKNIYYFYREISQREHFNDNFELLKFVDYFVYKASLLPIQTEGSNKEDAREKALKIFETINDRGRSLTDSDMFKAKLYSKALNKKEDKKFIQRWNAINDECALIDYTLDEIFKYYTHIIRGEKGIQGTETNLRDFFTRKKESPFNDKEYNLILDDLIIIVESIKLYNDVLVKPILYNEITKYFQLIKAHTNQYPFIAILVFMYKHKLNDENELLNSVSIVNFCKHVIRVSYPISASNQVQSPIYNIIASVMLEKPLKDNYARIKESDLEYFGRLKQAHALLAFYLNKTQPAINPHYFDKIINEKDVKNLDASWDSVEFNDYVDTLGNMLIIDFPKKNVTLKKKLDSFKKSSISELKDTLSIECRKWEYGNYIEREKRLKMTLLNFFNETLHENK